MEELKKINRKVAFKQKGRLIGGVGSVIVGMILIGKFIYQKRITSSQIAISKEFPEEYAAMTEKLAEAFEHTFVEES